MKYFLIYIVLLTINLHAVNPNTEKRTNWKFNEIETIDSSKPSNLKYLEYYDMLPDELTLKIFDKQDLSHLKNRKLFIGYAVADKEGKDCKLFKKEDTGLDTDQTVCLPWWRIERKYRSKESETDAPLTFLDRLKIPKAPLTVNYCKKYSDEKEYPGGRTTCTSYYDRNAGGTCWDNPMQARCFVDNCSQGVKDRCDYIETAIGEVTTLPSAVLDKTTQEPIKEETKVNLKTNIFECPAGPLSSDVECEEEENVIMFPFECETDDPATAKDDGEYVYCDEKSPNFGSDGKIESFNGKCSDGRDIKCEVNSFKNTTKICTEPIYKTEFNTELKSTELVRTYEEQLVDVLSGEADIYSANKNCLRSNDVEQAREQELYVKIVGSGSLDDDIYVLRHKADGGHTKVYCNMQHNENHGSRKAYNGSILQCIDNNGAYSFNQTVPIETTDIVTVQQNSENENSSGVPFTIGRNHYSSTKVTIDGIEVAPNTYSSNFPSYPANGPHLRTWDNTTATFSILFPFAGAYEVYFYNKNDEELAKAVLDMEDFREIAVEGSLQLKLGRTMKLAPGMNDDIVNEDGTKTIKANRDDMWVEWGGGVYGGKSSKTGEPSSSPNDGYVKNNSVTKIIIKDLLTNNIVPLSLVYPLPYPNRIFVSKLKVYEYRKYRCYDDFPTFNLLGETTKAKYVCGNTPQWHDFENGLSTNIGDLEQWENNDLCEQNCRTYNVCTEETRLSKTGYTCTQRGGENIGGDIEGNFFSNKDTCDSVCFEQNSCNEYSQSNCQIVDEQPIESATDFTGKTIYKKMALSYRCETREDKQIGCAKYDIKVTEGKTNYSFGAVGQEEKDYGESFEKALVKAQMLEVGQQHIFSGWKGQCVYGMKWDFSYLSDPMTIMSYAMSTYSSAKFFEAEWATNLSTKFATYRGYINNAIDSGMDSFANSTLGQSLQSMSDNIDSVIDSSVSKFGELFSDGFTELPSGGMIGAGVLPTDGLTGVAVQNAQSELLANINSSLPMPNLNLTASQNLSNTLGTITNNVGDGLGHSNMFDYYSSTSSSTGILDPSIIDKVKDTVNNISGIDWDATVKINGMELKYGDYINITQGDLILGAADLAMTLAAPTEDDYTLADKLLKGYAGSNINDSSVVAYNSCMASIGASVPNLVGWSVSSSEHASSQLIAPWRHPLRMTQQQLSSIATVTSQKYVTSQFMMEETDNILLNVIAISPQAYMKAAQTICMGTKVSQAASHIQYEQNLSDTSGGGANVALSVAKAAIGTVCAPCGFAMTIVMDLYSNVFTKIDTCHDEKDAIQWDMLNFKTNKFMNNQMCHFITTECDKKVNFGFIKKCVRQRNEYCCYDQITTKVYAEGLKAQLNKGWEKCNNITIDDLKDISFRECREGEIAHINKCIPSDTYSEFERMLFRQANKNIDTGLVDGLINQATNSMAIPNK